MPEHVSKTGIAKGGNHMPASDSKMVKVNSKNNIAEIGSRGPQSVTQDHIV